MMVGMKFRLRNILLAVPCFAMAIGIYVQHERFQADIVAANKKRQTLEGMGIASRDFGLPRMVPDKRAAIVVFLVGVALLFQRWRITAAIGLLILIGVVLDFVGRL